MEQNFRNVSVDAIITIASLILGTLLSITLRRRA